ncbi:MAG: hypothetical protein JRN24_02545 [Nitrososphaerota archaeon]|nr:hypothetical protein [Nitrososphaerota archaeon]
MLSLAKTASLIAGLLLVISGLVGGSPLALGLILGIGVIILSGRLKHRLWSAVFLVAGLLAYSSFRGLVGQGGIVLLVVAAALGLASTFV